MKLLTRTIVIVVAHRQFNDEEYAAVTAVFAREGARVRVAGSSLQPAIGSAGTVVRPVLLLSDIHPRSCDALIFIGGNGARDYWMHPRAHNLVRTFHEHGRILAAICVAPVVFAGAGLLKGKDAACHPSARRDLERAGAQYVADPVHVEERIVTASGPAAAIPFAEAIAALISD